MSVLRTLAGLACVGALASALAPGVAIAGGEGWSHDMAAAMKQAKEEKKDLLMDFTGSDWCGWCIKLNEEVFSQEAFKKDAPSHFILVELDFPNDTSHLSEETQKQNAEWRDKLAVAGYPTIFLADEQGRPYAQTGYQDGGADKYVAHLAELREKRVERDKGFAAAEKAKGVDKAKALDTAMDAVGEDLALNAYADQVKEIIKLDAKNEAGLKEKYEQKLAGVEFDKVILGARQSFDGQNAEAILKSIDDAIAKYNPSKERLLGANMLKAGFLGAAEKHEEALAITETLLADASLEPMQKIQIGLQKVNSLQQLKKIDDAIKTFDEIIANSPSPNITAQLILRKAMVLAEAGKTEEANKAFDEATAAAGDDDQLKAYIEQAKAQSAAKPETPAGSGE